MKEKMKRMGEEVMEEKKNYLIVGVYRNKDTNKIKSVGMFEMPELCCEDLIKVITKGEQMLEISFEELLKRLDSTKNLYFVARDTARPGIEYAVTKAHITKDDAEKTLNSFLKVDYLKNRFEID